MWKFLAVLALPLLVPSAADAAASERRTCYTSTGAKVVVRAKTCGSVGLLAKPAGSGKPPTSSAPAATKPAASPVFDAQKAKALTQGELTQTILRIMAADGFSDLSPTYVTEVANIGRDKCRLLNEAWLRNETIKIYKKHDVYKPAMETVQYWIREAAGATPTDQTARVIFEYSISNYCSYEQTVAVYKAARTMDFNS